MALRTFIAVIAWLPAVVWAAEPMPAGIGIRMTIVGPAFVDEQGMTLYQRSGAQERARYDCSDRAHTVRPVNAVAYNQVEEFPMRVPDAGSRRSCAEKYPPLTAPADATPIGHWAVHRRENGVWQWTYRGKPLHRSIKDKAPGQINGWTPQDMAIQHTGWGIAKAPLDAPSGIQVRLTSLGLALAAHDGKTLYHAVSDSAGDRAVPTRNWRPVVVPAAVVAIPDNVSAHWSIETSHGGLRQWAWKGKLLYTYAGDHGDVKVPDGPRSRFVDVFGDTYGEPIPGWQVALLKPASPPPAGVHVKPAHPQIGRTNKIYADAKGKTLYAIHCAEFTPDQLDCDDVGDSPRYWLSFCGGEQRCSRDWKPLVAPRGAAPIDGLWSVSTVNPSHPFKPLRQGETGTAIWTYRGRPVFTFAEDLEPDDTNGQFDFYSTVMSALPIYAFAARSSHGE